MSSSPEFPAPDQVADEQRIIESAKAHGWLPLYYSLRDLEQRAGEFPTTKAYLAELELILENFFDHDFIPPSS